MKISAKTKMTIVALILVVLILGLTTLPVLAWFYLHKDLAVYAPVSSPEALYIGAGHCEEDRFEDIRYLYFNGIDARDEGAYWDHVFCVYGKAVSGFKLQLAYTTNNQFTYEIFCATESTVYSENAIPYVTHTDDPTTYYYTIDGDALAGTYLNKTEVDGEILASSAMHTETYGSYASVQKNAEPIYWQTDETQEGNARGTFANYFIMRVSTNEKIVNDRETDVICLSAKSFSLSS